MQKNGATKKQQQPNNPRFLTLGGMFVEGVSISCRLSCQCLCVLPTDTHWTLTGTLSEEARPPRIRKTDRFYSLHKTLLKSIVKNSCSLIGKREGQRSTITMQAAYLHQSSDPNRNQASPYLHCFERGNRRHWLFYI